MTGRPLVKDHRRIETLAGLYGLRLRQQGLAPDEAAQLVIERYPSMRPRLEAVVRRSPEILGTPGERENV